jgi:hypothetical protein
MIISAGEQQEDVMSAQPFMWPFSLFAPGNLSQPILPGWSFGNVTVNYAGNAEIEKDVVEKVASYGKQLGIITDAVLKLANNPVKRNPGEAEEDPIARLHEIAERVAELKELHKATLLREARSAMERLARDNPDAASYVASTYAGAKKPGG